MVSVRNGLGYDTVQGALSIIAGTAWALVITSFISRTDSEVRDQMFGGIMLVWAAGPILVLVGLYSIYSDRKKRKRLGFTPYWGTIIGSYLSFSRGPPPEIGHFSQSIREN